MDTSAAPQTAAGPDSAPPAADQVSVSSAYLTRLENTNREYGVTVNTLAIVVEKLLAATSGGDTLYIESAWRESAPDLRAGANDDGRIWIKVSR